MTHQQANLDGIIELHVHSYVNGAVELESGKCYQPIVKTMALDKRLFLYGLLEFQRY
jgi:hypothetical protein